MPLTDIAVRNAKPGEKKIRLRDERGLFLEVSAGRDGKARKWWRLRYKLNGRENMLSLGVYPDVTLKDARDRRDEARRLMAQGIDPGEARKAQKVVALEDENTFERVTREWFAKFQPNWTASHGDRIIRRFELDVFPWLGSRPIREVEPQELLTVIQRIESRGAVETAHRALQNCGQVYRYAVATGRAIRDISGDLRGAIPPSKEKHHASIIEPKLIAPLLRNLDNYQGSFVVGCALRLAPLVFVRPGELRRAEWTEINLDAQEWRIPAAKMKMREQHIVPLSRQSIAIIQELHPLTGHGRYLFPSERTLSRPMSENTVNGALRRMGYSKDEMTGHGFRSMASTSLNEMGFNRDWVERQLAHAERNNIRGAYNFAEYLPDRRKMMQAWADHLDALKFKVWPTTTN
jgi:integrase